MCIARMELLRAAILTIFQLEVRVHSLHVSHIVVLPRPTLLASLAPGYLAPKKTDGIPRVRSVVAVLLGFKVALEIVPRRESARAGMTSAWKATLARPRIEARALLAGRAC